MTRSKKLTVKQWTQEVAKLLVAGAEFGNIQQYADQHGWQVDDRQLRRYIRSANRDFEEVTRGNRRAILVGTSVNGDFSTDARCRSEIFEPRSMLSTMKPLCRGSTRTLAIRR